MGCAAAGVDAMSAGDERFWIAVAAALALLLLAVCASVAAWRRWMGRLLASRDEEAGAALARLRARVDAAEAAAARNDNNLQPTNRDKAK